MVPISSDFVKLGASSIWLWVVPLLYFVCVFEFGKAWLEPGLPEGDLAGAVADLARWQYFFTHAELWSGWDPTSFLGHPRSLVNLYSGMAMAYAPFLAWFDLVMAVKVGSLFYMAMAGWTAFLLIRAVTRHTGIGLILGLGYALHPIHLRLTFASSHANFPPFYMVLPLVVWAVIRLCERPTARRGGITAVIMMLAGWLDLERLAVLMPGLVVLATIIVITRWWRYRRRSEAIASDFLRQIVIVGMGVTILTILLLAFLWVPAVADRAHHALFSATARDSSREFFSIQNLYYYLDPAGRMLGSLYTGLPSELGHDVGNFYLGWGTMFFIIVGILVPASQHRRVDLFVGSLLALAVTLAAAHGSHSGFQSLSRIMDDTWLHVQSRTDVGPRLLLVTLGCMLLVVLLVLTRFYWCRTGAASWHVFLLAAGLSILLFAQPFKWCLQYVPPFSEMRNPGWFATGLPPLVMLLACGLSLAAVIRLVNKPTWQVGILVVTTVFLAVDVWPYREAFDHQLPSDYLQELAIVGEMLQADLRDGRVLSRESYNPHTDMAFAYGERPAAWYWLNWMAPKGTGRVVMDEIYSNLHRRDTIDKALRRAGAINVRFILYDLTQGPLPPQNQALLQKWKGQYLALYENTYCRPWAELGISTDAVVQNSTSSSSPSQPQADVSKNSLKISRIGGDQIRVRVHATSPAVVLVRESWTPRWQSMLDATPVTVRATEDAMLAVRIPAGEHEVIFSYQSGWWRWLGVVLSSVGLLGVAICVLGRPRCFFASARTIYRHRRVRISCQGGTNS